MKPTTFKIALIAAALNNKETSRERVDFAIEIWKITEKALAPKRFTFSDPHPLVDFLEKLMPNLSKHDDRLLFYRQFVIEMNLEHGYQEKSNFQEWPSLRMTRKMAEKQAEEEIGLQEDIGVTHAHQVACNFVTWKKSQISDVRRGKGKKGAAARNSPEYIKKREEKRAAEAGALARRVRYRVIPIVDFLSRTPSQTDLSWGPLDISGISTRDGWTINAIAESAVSIQLPEVIDLSDSTHLVLQLRRENGGDSDVLIKLVCTDGERLFKIKSNSIPLQMQEILIPLQKGKGQGSVSSVKEVWVLGDSKKRRQFAYTLKQIESEKIILMM